MKNIYKTFCYPKYKESHVIPGVAKPDNILNLMNLSGIDLDIAPTKIENSTFILNITGSASIALQMMCGLSGCKVKAIIMKVPFIDGDLFRKLCQEVLVNIFDFVLIDGNINLTIQIGYPYTAIFYGNNSNQSIKTVENNIIIDTAINIYFDNMEHFKKIPNSLI